MSELAASTTKPATVVLVARRWVRVPRTPYEVYLHGKSGSIPVHRNGGSWDGWSIPAAVYVRRVTTSEQGRP